MSHRALGLLVLVVSCLLLAAGATDAGQFTGSGQIVRKTMPQQPYAGSQARRYEVYIPKSYAPGTPAPMLVALHGCAMQDAAPASDVLAEWNLDLIADRENVIVVAPFITSYALYPLRAESCWGYWMDGHIHAGAGEAEDIHRIALQVERDYSIDPRRRYIAGISAGGAMAIIQATAYSTYWAAAVPIEALPYGDWDKSVTSDPPQFKPLNNLVAAMQSELKKTRGYRAVPMLEIHSTNDQVANFGSAGQIRDVALTVFGSCVSQPAASTVDCTYEGIACIQQRYLDAAGKVIIETRFYQGDVSGTQCGSLGCGHYWVGDDGSTDNWSYDKGPINSEAAWAFLKNKRYPGEPATPPSVPTELTARVISYNGVTLSWTASTDNAAVAGYEILKDSVPIGTSTAPSYKATGLLGSTKYAFAVTAFDDEGTPSAPSEPLSVTTAPPPADPDPPSVPTGLRASDIRTNSLVLSWTASTDAFGVAGYEVLKSLAADSGYSSIGTLPGTAMNISGLTPDTGYYFKVRAFDSKPNYSEPSASTLVKTAKEWTCKHYTGSNVEHVQKGRATMWLGVVYARGSGARLGWFTMYPANITVAETSAGYFIKGNCQN